MTVSFQSQVGASSNDSLGNAGDTRNSGSIPRSGRVPGVASGHPLQYAERLSQEAQRSGIRGKGTKSRNIKGIRNKVSIRTLSIERVLVQT